MLCPTDGRGHAAYGEGAHANRGLRADERTRLTPVVVLTAPADDEEMIGGSQAGANSCIRKPGDTKEFCEAVIKVAEYWRLLDYSRPKS